MRRVVSRSKLLVQTVFLTRSTQRFVYFVPNRAKRGARDGWKRVFKKSAVFNATIIGTSSLFTANHDHWSRPTTHRHLKMVGSQGDSIIKSLTHSGSSVDLSHALTPSKSVTIHGQLAYCFVAEYEELLALQHGALRQCRVSRAVAFCTTSLPPGVNVSISRS